MMTRNRTLSIAIALTALVGCSNGKNDASAPASITSVAAASAPASAFAADGDINPRLLRRFQPLPSSMEIAGKVVSRERTDLGRMLYFETRLSKNGDHSCNSCHGLDTWGVDNQKTSAGFGGKRGTRNSPTVYNAAGHFVQFWDGRAPDVETQAKGPILNPIEMAMTDEASVVKRLGAIPGYRTAFASAFPGAAEPLSYDNVGTAIGAFERGLVTPGRWDRYLRGDKNALTTTEKNGLKTFLNAGCMVCHTGAYLGGSSYERVGAVEPWPNQVDQGRAQVTKSAGDRMMFKVPSLRNVEKTAPYFHDGSAQTLDEAVRMMGRHQLGLDFSEEETAGVVAWLKSLTGDLPPADYIAKPVLP
jgi:cytochrome c peroxidase